MSEPGPDRQIISDDPTAGRDLSRRLVRVVPVALIVGAAIGIPLAMVLDEWRLGVIIPLMFGAVAGMIAAAIEDGRVQRRVDRLARRSRSPARRGR